MISVGQWAGIYVWSGYSKRLCLGWIALTFIPGDDLGLLPDKGQIVDALDED